MNEKPILFSAPMVRAILAGRKTQTRRSVKPGGCSCPYGKPSDRLWVKETHRHHLCAGHDREELHFAADGDFCPNDGERIKPWRPSIFMRRVDSRIVLEVTTVRVERLADITRDDALAEGILYDENLDGYCYDEEGRGYHASIPVRAFENLWCSINGPGSWESNPWVWVITFKRIEP